MPGANNAYSYRQAVKDYGKLSNEARELVQREMDRYEGKTERGMHMWFTEAVHVVVSALKCEGCCRGKSIEQRLGEAA